MSDVKTNDWQMRGKEASPAATLEKIQGILKGMGFEWKIDDIEVSVENCYSCRLTITGPTGDLMGTNGKGMTRELCYASAFGEMMERLSNRLFVIVPRRDDPKPEELMVNGTKFVEVFDENTPECVGAIRQKLIDSVDTPLFMMTKEDFIDGILKEMAPEGTGGKYVAIHAYSVSDGEYKDLPGWILSFLGSNGMAAGNTLEEAMVEGLSEIVERYSQMKIMDGDIVPPEIPYSFIEKIPHIDAVIKNIEKSGRYKVRVLDCSLGMGLPVVCGIIIDREKGTFGIKFGAQPNFAVALERVFTESMQGTRLEQFATNSYIDFEYNKKDVRLDKWNALKVGTGRMPEVFFKNTPTYEFTPWQDCIGKSNHDIMMGMVRQLEKYGSKVYVKDVSYLGFPAVFIYASGFSEVRPMDIIMLKENKLYYDVQKHFLHLYDLSDEEVADIYKLSAIKSGAVLENTISSMTGLPFADTMPGAPCEAEYLNAMCSYRLGNVKAAASKLNQIAAKRNMMSKENAGRVLAASLYVSGIASGLDADTVKDVLDNLCPEWTKETLEVFSDPKHVLERSYPVVRGDNMLEYTEGGCMYKAVHDFYAKLVAAENAHPVDPENIVKVFKR